MKKVIFYSFLLSLSSLACFAQGKSVMLYPDYQKGIIYMNGNQKITVPVNYDAGKHCIMYQQNGEDMILTNTQSVDSMKIGNDDFCRIRNKFYQVISYPEGKLLIDWNLNKVNVGYKGAYGTVSQARSQSINLSLMEGQEYSASKPDSQQDVYKTRNNNKYLLLKNGKLNAFSNKKSLLKLFTSKQKEVEDIIKMHNTDFTKAEDIITLAADVFPLLP